MYKKILLAMDGSEDAKRAAKRAIEISEPGITLIIAFHSYKHHMIPMSIPIAVIGMNPIQYTPSMEKYAEIEKGYLENGKKILNETKQLFLDAKLDIETRLITEEDPEDYIKNITMKENFDLVVMGCKGNHSKFKQVLIGSLAQKILNSKTPTDILFVR